MNTKKPRKQKIKFRKIKENYNEYKQHLQKTKKTTKLQNIKQNDLNKRNILIRKQTKSNREKKQNERRKKKKLWYKILTKVSFSNWQQALKYVLTI